MPQFGWSGENVVHSCFQWILTLYGVLIKNPTGVGATPLGILRNPRWLLFHWNGYTVILIRHRRFIFESIPVFGFSQSIECILYSAKLWHNQKIQYYGRQYGCCSEYYSNSVHSYSREILCASIPTFSRLLNTLEQLLLRSYGYRIAQFKVKWVQVLSTTPNFISYKQLFSKIHFKHWEFEWVGQFKWQPCSYNDCWIVWATRTKLKRNMLLLV